MREKFIATLRSLWRSAKVGKAGIYCGAGSVTITKERGGNISFFIENNAGWEVCYAKIVNGVVQKLLPDELSEEEWGAFDTMVAPYCESYTNIGIGGKKNASAV